MATIDSFFATIPLWLLFLVTASITFAGFEVGWLLGNRQRKRDKTDSPVGAIVAATFGLLAFLLAFTFNFAANRFEQHKQLVLAEANAISTVYLRTDFVPEPQRSAIRSDLKTYAQLRAEGITALLNPAIHARTEVLETRIWANTVSGVTSENTFVDNLLVQAVNALFDADSARIQAGHNQVPDAVWVVLYAATILCMATAGYQFGLAGERRWVAVLLLVATFALVTTLIADLDRPQAGSVQVSQQPILDAIIQMDTGQMNSGQIDTGQ